MRVPARPKRGPRGSEALCTGGWMKTYSAREADIQRRWFVVDAEGKTLGRLATAVFFFIYW